MAVGRIVTTETSRVHAGGLPQESFGLAEMARLKRLALDQPRVYSTNAHKAAVVDGLVDIAWLSLGGLAAPVAKAGYQVGKKAIHKAILTLTKPQTPVQAPLAQSGRVSLKGLGWTAVISAAGFGGGLMSFEAGDAAREVTARGATSALGAAITVSGLEVSDNTALKPWVRRLGYPATVMGLSTLYVNNMVLTHRYNQAREADAAND